MSQESKTGAQGWSALPEGRSPVEMFPAELLATVGHEFRGPLTAIQGYATTLLRHDQRLTLEERREFLSAINEASVHLGTLVDRFLDLALFETHGHPFFPVQVNLRALAQESITAAQKSHSHQIALVPASFPMLAAEAGGPETDEWSISGDRRMLRTMLDLLLENAVRYSAPGSLVEVSIEEAEAAAVFAQLRTPSKSGIHRALILPGRFQEDEELLIVRVQDHGIGIEPEHLPLIFRRFARVDLSLTRAVNGLGLGLALCKAIVERHQGILWVESAVGEGSTFAVAFSGGRYDGDVGAERARE